MFERFTDRARRSLVLAQDEAHNLEHNFIGTEHLLLGLLAEGTGVAAVTLAELGLTLERARDTVTRTIGPQSKGFVDKPPFTPRSKKVLELSLREALSLGHNYIGTEHILLGLIREGDGVGAQMLMQENIPLATAREAVLSRIQEASAASGTTFGSRPVLGPTVSMGSAPIRLASHSPGQRRAVAGLGSAALRLARETPGETALLSSHHYLLALFEDPDSMAAKALFELGVTKQQVQEALARLDIGQTSDAPPSPPPQSIPLEIDLGQKMTLRIGDRDLAQRLIENKEALDQLLTMLRRLDPDLSAQSSDSPEPE